MVAVRGPAGALTASRLLRHRARERQRRSHRSRRRWRERRRPVLRGADRGADGAGGACASGRRRAACLAQRHRDRRLALLPHAGLRQKGSERHLPQGSLRLGAAPPLPRCPHPEAAVHGGDVGGDGGAADHPRESRRALRRFAVSVPRSVAVLPGRARRPTSPARRPAAPRLPILRAGRRNEVVLPRPFTQQWRRLTVPRCRRQAKPGPSWLRRASRAPGYCGKM